MLAIHDFLFEHTVLVTDAVAHGRNAQGCQRVEEAGGQTAQTAVTQTRIFFLFADIGKFFAQLLKGFFKFGVNAFVNQRVDKRTAEQEFHRQVINHAFTVVNVGAACFEEIFRNQVTRGKHGGVEPLV